MNRDELHDSLDVALEARAEARLEIAAAALETTTEHLAELDLGFWERLGPDVRRKLLLSFDNRSAGEFPASHPEPKSARFRINSLLNLGPISPPATSTTSATMIGLAAGVIASLICIGIGLFCFSGATHPKLSFDGSPICRRLTDTESCFYAVQHEMSFVEAAAAANIPVPELRADNLTVQSDRLVKGDVLWLNHPASTDDQ